MLTPSTTELDFGLPYSLVRGLDAHGTASAFVGSRMAEPSYQARRSRPPAVDGLGPDLIKTLPAVAQRTPVGQAMEKVSFLVGPDMDLVEVLRLLTDMGAHAVPVVDGQGEPIGIIAKTSVIAELYERRRAVTRRSSGVYPAVAPGVTPGEPNRPPLAGDVMIPLSTVVTEETSLAKAAALIAYQRVHPLPVMDDQGQVVGILSSLDVLRWLTRNDGH
jgi:CBS domain-containing protein